MVEKDRKPSIDQLREMMQHPIPGGFNLHPSIETSLKVSDSPEDQEDALRDQAREIYSRELSFHPNHKTNREKMRFIQRDVFGWTYDKMALFMRVSHDEVKIFETRGLRERQLDNFREQFEGLYSIASILKRRVEEKIDRRGAVFSTNGILSDLRIADLIKAGKINLAVSITENALRDIDSMHYIEPDPNVLPDF